MSMENFLKTIGDEKPPVASMYNNETFSAPYKSTFASGEIEAASDLGDSRLLRNEDRIIVAPEQKSFAVLDGMGGYGNGNIMADILSEELLKEISGPITERGLSQCHIRASMKMKQALKGYETNGGCAYILCKYNQRELAIVSAGDVEILVIDKNDKEVEMSQSRNLSASPTATNPGKPTIDFVSFFGGNYAILGSDGFWENITKEEVLSIVTSEKRQDVFRKLSDIALARQKTEDGKKDNISLVVVNI